MRQRIKDKQQVILFLNRRGYSFFVQCKACSFIFECTNCSVSLTLHEQQQLICHYCGFLRNLPPACPSCKVDEKSFLKKGIGTQQLVNVVQKLLPEARIARADMDTSAKKKQWKETMQQFQAGEIDILVGTQTITKGYHFPKVTLVGIIWADLNLHFPRYNATETTLQQLIQVAGRAGRQTEHSLVIVQTMTQHHVFDFLKETSYLRFYQQELAIRQEVGYPPCKRLVEIECKHANEQTVHTESLQLAQTLLNTIEQHELPVQLLGPAKPPIAKIKNAHTRILFLKSDTMHVLYRLFQSADSTLYKSSIFFTPNPL